MRLDHIAYRVRDRYKTAKFFKDTLGYTIGTEFRIEFDDESKADCLALVPSEVRHPETHMWTYKVLLGLQHEEKPIKAEFHAPPEIFISSGPVGSIVGDWVAARDNIGGVHHVAYQVDDVEAKMKEWKQAGYAEFLSDKPMTCPGLVQVFTKPSELTGVIYELISREGDGFCEDNVKNLMLSTVE
jgi:catechol 2,3-dioxygenase-like lactoylglutathione lyase family enzyme